MTFADRCIFYFFYVCNDIAFSNNMEKHFYATRKYFYRANRWI
jgi:hypothetical protein